MAIAPERALEVTGASLQLETVEDWMPGYDTEDLDTIFSALAKARTELQDNIRNSVEQMGDEAPRHIGVVSRPSYYVNGVAVGNRTYLSIDKEFYYHYGSEPNYVWPYQSARWQSYKALLDRSITHTDFIALMDFSTGHEDAYFAQHLYRDLRMKKQGPQSYIFTPQHTIDRAEKERVQRNDFIDALHDSIKGHNRKAADGELEAPPQEKMDENEVIRNLVIHKRWLTRRGYAKYLGATFLDPLLWASDKPIIEKRILDEVFREAGLPSSTVAQTM